MAGTITRKGIRFTKQRSRGGHWGPSKVHYAKKHSGTRSYEPVCMPLFENASFGHGYSNLDDVQSEEVDCKKCIRWMERHTA